ncbi:hypothetical protein MASR2M41_22460 [Flammeovirgaceae bacterium]
MRFNEPYLGIDDGLTSYLRTQYSNSQYAGVEIEINQKFISDMKKIKVSLADGLKKVLFP